MKPLRFGAKKIESADLEKWIGQSVTLIFKLSAADKVILFGSALGDDFDEFSDLDFVCVDEKTFQTRSQMRGVLLIAQKDGRFFLRPN